MIAEARLFIPPALADRADAPEFLLRDGPEGSLVDAIAAAGLRQHPTAEFRREALRALNRLWRGQTRRDALNRLRRLWRKLDSGGTLPPGEDVALRDLSARLAAASPRFASMCADNAAFSPAVLRVAVSLVLDDWRGLPFRPEAVAGTITLHSIAALEVHLATLGPAGQRAWTELADEAALSLTRHHPRASRPMTKELSDE